MQNLVGRGSDMELAVHFFLRFSISSPYRRWLGCKFANVPRRCRLQATLIAYKFREKEQSSASESGMLSASSFG